MSQSISELIDESIKVWIDYDPERRSEQSLASELDYSQAWYCHCRAASSSRLTGSEFHHRFAVDLLRIQAKEPRSPALTVHLLKIIQLVKEERLNGFPPARLGEIEKSLRNISREPRDDKLVEFETKDRRKLLNLFRLCLEEWSTTEKLYKLQVPIEEFGPKFISARRDLQYLIENPAYIKYASDTTVIRILRVLILQSKPSGLKTLVRGIVHFYKTGYRTPLDIELDEIEKNFSQFAEFYTSAYADAIAHLHGREGVKDFGAVRRPLERLLIQRRDSYRARADLVEDRNVFDALHQEISKLKEEVRLERQAKPKLEQVSLAEAERKRGWALFRVPRNMWLETEELAELRLTPKSKLTGELQKQMEASMRGRGRVSQKQAVSPIGKYMRATLQADENYFRIIPLGLATQEIADDKPLLWDWKIMPLKTGRSQISISMAMMTTADHHEVGVVAEAMHKTISVSVRSVWTHPKRFWRNHWKWVLGGGSGLGVASMVYVLMSASAD